MSVLQQVIGWASVLQMTGLFAILLYRGHSRRAPVFTMYAGGVAITNAIYGMYYTFDTWMVHQVAAAALRFGVALELTYGIFGAFPAAAATARRVLFALLIATAVTAMSVSAPDATYAQISVGTIPRLSTGAVWILTALAGLVLWYRLPLGVLQKAILMGFAPYLIIFTLGLNLLTNVGWHLRSWVGYVDNLSFFLLVNYWCRVAWRTAPEASMPYAPAAHVPRQAS